MLRPGRLVGIDLARTVALVGMIATHVLDPRTTTGELTFTEQLAGGRASALFAVLAGLSMALISGGREPVVGRERVRTSLGLAARAVLVALVGLALGGLETGLAIILVYYAVLFLLGLPFLGLRARTLAVLAAVWALAAPLLSHLVRPALPPRTLGSPDFGSLADPGQLVGELLLTGSYPALPWLAYLLAGMALGRADLRGWRTPLLLAVQGAALALLATAVSRLATSLPEVRHALVPWRPTTEDELLAMLAGSQHGTTPADGAWQWLLVVAPHSATPLDLAQTIGSALVVIGACLALVAVVPRPGRVVLTLLAGAGAMPLTLYTLHVVMRTPDVWPAERADTFGLHVAVVLVVGAAFAAAGRRGPLEWLVGWPGRRLRAG